MDCLFDKPEAKRWLSLTVPLDRSWSPPAVWMARGALCLAVAGWGWCLLLVSAASTRPSPTEGRWVTSGQTVPITTWQVPSPASHKAAKCVTVYLLRASGWAAGNSHALHTLLSALLYIWPSLMASWFPNPTAVSARWLISNLYFETVCTEGFLCTVLSDFITYIEYRTYDEPLYYFGCYCY